MVSWWAGGRDSTRSRMQRPRRDSSWISAREGGYGGVQAPAVTTSLSPPASPSLSHLCPNPHPHPHPTSITTPCTKSCLHSHSFSISFLSPTPSLYHSPSHLHSIPVPIPTHPIPTQSLSPSHSYPHPIPIPISSHPIPLLSLSLSLTDGSDELVEVAEGDERLRQLPQEELQRPGDNVDVLPAPVIQVQLLVWRWGSISGVSRAPGIGGGLQLSPPQPPPCPSRRGVSHCPPLSPQVTVPCSTL